jgi:hypothetical protein
MDWLRKLLTPTLKAPSYGREVDTPEPIDWAELEDRLLRLAEATVAHVAERRPNDSFYGLALDFSSESGEVLIHLNTRDKQRRRAQETAANPQLCYGKSEAELFSEQEWDIGGWKLHGVNLRLAAWKAEWRDVEPRMTDAVNILLNNGNRAGFADLRRKFTTMASRAALRLRTSSAISTLSRDADFRILCVEHHEGPAAGFERLERMAVGEV